MGIHFIALKQRLWILTRFASILFQIPAVSLIVPEQELITHVLLGLSCSDTKRRGHLKPKGASRQWGGRMRGVGGPPLNGEGYGGLNRENI